MRHPIDFIRPFVMQPLCYRGNSVLPERKREKFFLSFGDAITCIFKEYNCSPEKDIALMPNYFCTETLDVISRYLHIVFYKVHDDFSIDTDDYFSKIQLHRPRVIWNYDFLGVSFTQEQRSLLKNLAGSETIFIEDYAHRILHHSDIQPLNNHHFYIDSIRKHSSFLGAHLINDHFMPTKGSVENWNFYKVKACVYRIIQNYADILFYCTHSKLIASFATKIFLLLNDSIGNYTNSTYGEGVSFYGYRFLNLQKIEVHNKKLARTYNTYFQKIRSPLLRTLSDTVIQQNKLISYYPLFVDNNIIKSLEAYLESHGIAAGKLWEIESHYDGLHESLYNSFIVFPLTWLIQEKDVLYCYETILKFFNKNT